MEEPVILLVMADDGPPVDGAVQAPRTEREIRGRYGSEYDVQRVDSVAGAKAKLQSLVDRDAEVALVLAALRLSDGAGEDLLAWIRELHGNIKRCLIVTWGDNEARARVLKAMSMGVTESWVYAPNAVRDEQFHRAISELLEEWDRWSGVDLSEIVVVGPRLSAECQQVREVLLRTGYPHRFCEVDSPEGKHILTTRKLTLDDVPVVNFPSGMFLRHPAREELAEACGFGTKLSRPEYDVAIVGAGPAGLSAATYAASEGLTTVLLEQESMGGQAGSSSLIRNYLGFPRGVSGPELASRAYQQAWLFGADLLYGSPVQNIERQGDHLMVIRGHDQPIRARAVIVATGVQYQQLDIPSVQALVGAGIFYGSAMSAAPSMAHDAVVVVGGGNSAGQAALHLAKHEAHVTMVVRGTSFAESMSRYLIDEIERAPNVDVAFETELAGAGGSGRLETITLRNRRTGETKTQPAAGVFIFIGMGPHTDWLPDSIKRDAWGFIETGQAPSDGRAAMPYETSMPGVFAVGDVRHGSIKRVASAVGEGSICVPQVHEYLERNVHKHTV